MQRPEDNLTPEYIEWARKEPLDSPVSKYISDSLKYRKYLEERLRDLEALVNDMGEKECNHEPTESSRKQHYIKCQKCGKIGRIIK